MRLGQPVEECESGHRDEALALALVVGLENVDRLSFDMLVAISGLRIEIRKIRNALEKALSRV